MNHLKKIVVIVFMFIAITGFTACDMPWDDTTAPAIAGTSDFTVEAGAVAPDWLNGVVATDNQDGNLTSAIAVNDNAVDLTTVNAYDLIYTVADNSGNTSTIIVSVNVVDTTDPVIAGTQDFIVEVGGTADYMAGVTATDAYDGDLTSAIVVDSSAVNLTVVGDYQVTYTVTDENNNEVTITVSVNIVDTVYPEILGTQDLIFEVGNTPNYLTGVTATDTYDGDLTSTIVVDSSIINLTVVGNYPLFYTVTDSSDNTVSLTVNVNIVDTTDPEFFGIIDFSVEVQSTPDYISHVVATDNYDGSVTGQIQVDTTAEDLSVTGTYNVTYTVTDVNGNTATADAEITVVDTTVPILGGISNFEVVVNDIVDYMDGVTAFDNLDGDITNQVQVDITAEDLSVVGTYIVTYSVTDANANSTSQAIAVTVIADLEMDMFNFETTLLMELIGGPLTQEQIDSLNEVVPLRVANYEVVMIPGMGTSPEEIQAAFVVELNEDEIMLIENYINMWTTLLFAPTNPALSPNDIVRIMDEYFLNRELTVFEIANIPVIDIIEEAYETAVIDLELTFAPEFRDASIEDVADVLGPLSQEQIEAININQKMFNEMLSKIEMVKMAQGLGRDLTEEEQEALEIMTHVIRLLSVHEGTIMPTAMQAQTILLLTFTEDECISYEVVMDMFDEYVANMQIEMYEDMIDTELTQEDKNVIRNYVIIMLEYERVKTEEDPEFNDATIEEIETVLDRSLTQQEIDDINYAISFPMRIMLAESLGREATAEEVDAVVLMMPYLEFIIPEGIPVMPSIADAQIILEVTFTAEEILAYGVIEEILEELVTNEMFDRMVENIEISKGIPMTEEEKDKLSAIMPMLMFFGDTQGFIPSMETAEIQMGVTFSAEEIEGYEFYRYIFVAMMLRTEVTEANEVHINAYLDVMVEYMQAYEGEEEVDIEDLSIETIEAEIERSLTQTELDAFAYFETAGTIEMIEELLGRSLTEAEIAQIPLVDSILDEIETAGSEDPEGFLYVSSTQEIETQIGRTLSQEEIDAIAFFKSIMDLMMP